MAQGRVRGMAVSMAAAGVFLLAACAGVPTVPEGGVSTPGEGPSTPTAPAVPVELVYRADASAEENLVVFDAVLAEAVAGSNGRPGGRTLVDALVAAGFPKKQMEVTRDSSRTGARADSVTVAVNLNGHCLIGQFLDSKTYSSLVSPALAASACLVGETRPIDW